MGKYGQVVVGPPGSGKTTYCKMLSNLLSELGRKVAFINLDPGNDQVPADVTIDVRELISVEEVMETRKLGPNGALIYCMEELDKNIEWLTKKLDKLHNHYCIFDFPGQAEFYSHHPFTRDILATLEKCDVHLCTVFLMDSHHANDAGKYISAVMLALNSMLHLEIPTVNCLSKIDLLKKYGDLKFGLDFYTDVLDLDYLVDTLDDAPVTKKFKKLNKMMAEIVTDYALVSFIPMTVTNKSSLLNVLKAVDKANGYVYGDNEERNIQRLLSCAVGAELEHDRIGEMKDEYNYAGDEDEVLKMMVNNRASS